MNPSENATISRLVELVKLMNDEQRERLITFAEGVAFAMEKKAG